MTLRREAARGEVLAGMRGLRPAQLLLEERAGAFVDVDESAAHVWLSRASSGEE